MAAQEYLVRLVHEEIQGPLVQVDLQDHLDLKGHQDKREIRVKRANWDPRDRQVKQELQGHLDPLGLLDQVVHLVLKAREGNLEHRDPKDRRENLVPVAQVDLQAPLGLLVIKAKLEKLVLRDQGALRDLQDSVERLVQLVQLDLKESEGLQDQAVLQGHLELKELKEN